MSDLLSRIIDLWDKSVITQSILTLAIMFTACYLWLAGKPVPNELYILAGSVIGFFFGTKTQMTVHKNAEAVRAAQELVAEVAAASPSSDDCD